MSEGTLIPRYRQPHLLRELQQHPQQVFAQAHAACGDIARLRFGPRQVFLVSSPALARFILRQEALFPRTQTNVERAISSLMGAPVVTVLEGTQHRTRRRVLAPAFSEAQVQRSAETAVQMTEAMIAAWADGAIIDLREALTRLTLQIACAVFLSTELHETDLDVPKVVSAYGDYLARRVTQVFWMPAGLPTPLNLRAWWARRRFRQFVQAILPQRKAAATPPRDVLDRLLAVGLSKRIAVAEIINLLTSYFPSTATVLAPLYHLLTTSDQERVRQLEQELEAVAPQRALSAADLPRLPLLFSLYHEGLRTDAFVPGLLRKTAQTVTLPGGYVLPRRSHVLVALSALHQREDSYPDAATFHLERFVSGIPRHAIGQFLPYGDGIHICLGRPQAELQGPLILGTLLRRVQFQLAPDQPAVSSQERASVLPRFPLRVMVHHREKLAP